MHHTSNSFDQWNNCFCNFYDICVGIFSFNRHSSGVQSQVTAFNSLSFDRDETTRHNCPKMIQEWREQKSLHSHSLIRSRLFCFHSRIIIVFKEKWVHIETLRTSALRLNSATDHFLVYVHRFEWSLLIRIHWILNRFKCMNTWVLNHRPFWLKIWMHKHGWWMRNAICAVVTWTFRSN